MFDPVLIRALCLLVPLAVAGLLLLRRTHDRRLMGAALFATMWNLSALLVLHLLAARFGWWRFDAQGGLFLGMPVDLYLGWALLWGAIPVLVGVELSMIWVTIILLLIDLALLPRFAPTILLGDRWLAGEVVGLALCLWPAQLLARWTYSDRHLAARLALLVLAYNGILLGVLPAAILAQTGGSWRSLGDHPRWLNILILLPMAVALLLKLTAVQEFALRAHGTPAPLDPPKRLVTTGIFAYLANPLELSICLLLAGLGALLSSWWVAAAALVGLVFSTALPAWYEDKALADRYGDAWRAYRQSVRRWWPRWRPWADPARPYARLYLADNCPSCSRLRNWLQDRHPAGIQLLVAEDHPIHSLRRLTYEAEGGYRAAGLAALARALEHLHLGWAFLGWTIRLPVDRSSVGRPRRRI